MEQINLYRLYHETLGHLDGHRQAIKSGRAESQDTARHFCYYVYFSRIIPILKAGETTGPLGVDPFHLEHCVKELLSDCHPSHRPAFAGVDLAAMAHNIQLIAGRINVLVEERQNDREPNSENSRPGNPGENHESEAESNGIRGGNQLELFDRGSAFLSYPSRGAGIPPRPIANVTVCSI